LDKSKLDRLRDLSQRFRHYRTDSHFQQWAQEVGAHERFGPVEARFEQTVPELRHFRDRTVPELG
jgi:hypothetical protein